MNKIFKTVWNTVRKCLVVVKETTKSAAQSSSAGGSVVDQSVAYSSKVTAKHSKHTFSFSALCLTIITALTSQAAFAAHHDGADWKKWIPDVISMTGTAIERDYGLYWPDNFTVTSTGGIMGFIRSETSTLHNVDNSGRVFLTTWNTGGTYYLDGKFQNHQGAIFYVGKNYQKAIEVGFDPNEPLFSKYANAGEISSLTINGGSIINDGELINSRPINLNSGTITNNNKWLVENVVNQKGGSLNGSSTVTVNGTYNLSGGSFSNKLDGKGRLVYSGGTFNTSLLTGDVILQINAGMNATVPNATGGKIDNYGTFSLTMGTLKNLITRAGGTTTLKGTSNANTITNQGTLNVTNFNAKSVSNSGVLNANGKLTFNGTLTNSGTLKALGDWAFGSGRLNSSGTVQTKHQNIFASLGSAGQQALNYIDMNVKVPQEVKTSLTDVFRRYVPGSVAKNLANHATFSGGKVIVSGVNITTTMRDDLTKAFKETFGSATEIVFEGKIEGVSKNDILNTAKVNELADANVLKDVIYVDRALEGENQSVVIGNNGVKTSTGFMSINNAKDVTVQDGKNLVLIGAKEADFKLTDATVMASGDASKLTLGTLGLADGADLVGSLSEVVIRGGAGLDVVNGSYSIADLTLRDSVKSAANVRKPANLTVGSVALMSGSSLTNEGTLTIQDKLEGLTNAVITNAEGGLMTVDGTTSIIGRLQNDGQFIARDEVSVNGTLTNNGEATISLFKVLGAVNNTGTINTSETSFVNGTLTNTGTIKLYNTTNIDKFSELTNTKDLTAEGTVTMNGILGNLDNADFETLVVSGKDSDLVNHGTIVIDELSLTDGAHAINGGARSSKYATFGLSRAGRATEQIRNFNVDATSQKTNAGIGYYGQGTIDGTFTNTDVAQTFFGVSDVFVDGQGVAIGATGQVQNAGTITFGGSLVNAGQITGDGKLIFKYDGASTNVFSNSGTIDVGQLEADNITYEHTAGSIQSDSGWFSNSTVNVKGGEMAHADLGVGNTYTVGLAGSQDTVGTLTIDRVTSDSDVNIIEGGNLVAKEIALTQDKKTVHLVGGTLSTTLNQIFANVDYSALDIDAENPDDKVDIEGVKIATGVSDVIDSVAKGIEFGWGTVAFDDASYSASMAADVLNKLDAVDTDPAGHEGQLEVAFNGKAAQSFNVDLANAVVAKDPAGGSTFATFANEELTNIVAANTGYTALFVGNADTTSAVVQPLGKDFNNLHTSIGFKGIRNVADGLYVGDGYHLVLVGEDQNKAAASQYQLADGTVFVTGGSRGVLGDPSTLTLGSYGTANKTAGHLNNLYVGVSVNDLENADSNGQLRVRHGDFTVDTLTNGGVILVGGNGENGMRLDTDASLSVKNYIDNGAAKPSVNYAIFNIENLSMGQGKGQGSLENRGTMTIGQGSYNGNLDNFGNLTVGTLVVENGGLDGQVGRYALTNHESAKMIADDLTIAGEGTWGTGATMRGGMTNAGELLAQKLTVDGSLDNSGKLSAGVLNVNTGSLVSNLTQGSMTLDALAFLGGSFDNAGLVNFAQKGDSTIASNFNNSGTLKVADNNHAFTIASGGQVTNDGTMAAEGKVTFAGGSLTNNKTAGFNGLDITSGQVINNTDSTLTDNGTTTISMANASDVAIANSGDLELADLDLVKGTITGGTMHVADANVSSEGLIDQVKGFFDALVNAGTVNLTSGQIAGLDNQSTGKITSAGDLALSGNNAGEVTVDGTLAVQTGHTFTNTGTVIANGETTIAGSFANNGQATLTQDATIAAGGTLSNNSTLTAQTVNVNQGGTLASSGGTSDIDTLNAQAGSIISVSGGQLSLGDLNASEVTYNQSGGSISADKGWFKESVLNISGGRLDATQIKDDQGNVTGSLGHNTVNISGQNPMPGINNEDTADNKSHWKDNLTVVNADVVTSETTINIASGGVLDVEDLQLTAPDSITLSGGGLQTSLSEIFNWVKTEAIKIDAEDPDSGTVEIPTTVLASTAVGNVQDSIKNGINFESGMVAFDDAHFSASTVISAGLNFGSAFTDSNVTLHFLGNMAEKFTIDTANKLIAEGLPEVLHGIVLDSTTLHNTSATAGDTNKNLVIGGTATDANSIAINMGFQNVANADNVTVTGGMEFALVGYQKPEGFDWTTGYDDTNKLLVDAVDGGSVTVENGTFTMGSDGVRNPTIGWVNSGEIGADGTLVVKNGEFAVWDITNNGTINVNKNGTLHTNSLVNDKTVNVAGNLTVDELNNANGTITNIGSVLVTGTDDLNGTINNGGTFEAQGGVTLSGNYTSDQNGKAIFDDLTLTGTMTNGGDLTIKGVEGVSDDEFKLTIAQGGKLENFGTINNTSHDTLVEGTLTNNGKAYYNDMTVATGGVSINSGYEKGEWLTVAQDGKHTNTGVSIWNSIDLSGVFENLATKEGYGVVIGSEDKKGQLTINAGGQFTNGSLLDATNVENTQVAGNLVNTDKGVANYDDMTIVAGGVSINDGHERGYVLTVAQGGQHTNSGVSIWNNAQIAGTAENAEGGKMGFEDQFNVNAGGQFTNNGELDATKVETTIVAGNLINGNKGVANYDDMNILVGGVSTNNGIEKGDILAIAGTWNQNGESHWNNIVVSANGETSFDSDSKTKADKISVDGGSLIVNGGDFVAKEIELNKGTFVVGNDKALSEDNKVDFVIEGETTINTNSWVVGNGNLALGSTTDFDSLIGMPELPDHPSRVTVGQTVTIGSEGSLAVGTGVWSDKDNHLNIANGDLYFAEDSTTIIDAGSLGENSAFAGSDTANVTVENGATLILGNIDTVGEYTITEGFQTAGNTVDGLWAGGWTEDNLYALPQSGSGLGWILDLHVDGNRIWVSTTLEDVRTLFPDIAIPDNVNDDLLNPGADGADNDFVNNVITDKNHGVGDKTTVINSVSEIGLASSSLALALNDLTVATNSIENRVSMMSEAFNSDGTMRRDGQLGHGLWADFLHSQQQADSYQATGKRSIGHDANSTGFVIGYDYLLDNQQVIVGGAVSYQKGDSDSAGNVLATKNDYSTIGAHAYAAYSPNPLFNVVGSMSYFRSSAEASQGLPFGGYSKAEADIDTDMLTAGVRAESTFKLSESVKVVPHAGVRVVHADSGSYDTKLDGQKAFKNDADAATLVQFPVGVAVRMDKTLDNGWTIRPQADVTVIPAAGDTEQTIRVTGTRNVSDTISGDYTGDFNTQMTLGMQADNGKTTFGARYGLNVGGDGKQDHSFKLEARFHF